jgi:hypothetical protein
LFTPAWAIVIALNSTRLTTRLRIVLIALLIKPPCFGNCAVVNGGLTSDEREHRIGATIRSFRQLPKRVQTDGVTLEPGFSVRQWVDLQNY